MKQRGLKAAAYGQLVVMLVVTMIVVAAATYAGAQEVVTERVRGILAEQELLPKDEHAILGSLDRVTSWYRRITAVKTTGISTREAYLATNLHQQALKTLRYSFDYARVQAALLEEIATQHAQAGQESDAQETLRDAEGGDDGGDAVKKEDASDQAFDAKRVEQLIKEKIARLEAELVRARAMRARGTRAVREEADAQIEKLTAELAMSTVQRDLVANVFTENTPETVQSIGNQIDLLAASIPELEKAKTASPSGAKSADGKTRAASESAALNAAAQTLLPGLSVPSTTPSPDAAQGGNSGDDAAETKGVIGLVRELLASLNDKQEMTALMGETKQLQNANAKALDGLRENIMAVVKRSNELSQGAGADIGAVQAQTAELNELTAHFKAMSDLMIPLGKQKRSLANAANHIAEWEAFYDAAIGETLGDLMGRLLTLLLALAIPFALSEIARRMVVQYVQDARLRRQLTVIRRVVLWLLIGLIVLLNLVSELGSFATFLGFVTAGVAVALQNVILSIVAYFFLFGRYGIRVGSRVSIQGTTGDVIEIGLVRLYLMEMDEESDRYRPTGRIVSFPNSILFQPTGFFKQVPGVSYRAHEITFMLHPDTDPELARTKLNEAVESIRNDTKDIVEMQRIALEKSTRMKMREPKTEGSLAKKAEGLSFSIRYPVDPERAEEIDKNVTKQIIEIFQKIPAVTHLTDEPPVIKRR